MHLFSANLVSIPLKSREYYSTDHSPIVSLSGAVFIDRKNRHDAVKAFDQVSKAMKDKGVSLHCNPRHKFEHYSDYIF